MGTARKVSGFTLVELLVAIAILGMVIGISSYGYSLFSRQWSGRLGQFASAQSQFQRLDLVVRALENTIPYVVRDERGEPGFYFLGRDQGLTLVTLSPVFTPAGMAVIRVFREPGRDGRWDLYYEEAPLTGVNLRQAGQVLPFQHRIRVLEGIEQAEFAYYGWQSAAQRALAADAVEPATPEWSSEFDGLVRRQHPQRIALRLGGQEAIVFVPDRGDLAFRRYMGRE